MRRAVGTEAEAVRERLQALEEEREALVGEIRRLREQLESRGDWGAWAAWEEAEGLLSQVLREAVTEGVFGEGPAPPDLTGRSPEGRGADLADALEASRHRLLAIRDALRERDRRLQELQSQKEELLSIVAHDLRTPLVAVQGFARLLQRTAETDGLSPKQAEYVERILQAAAAMNRLVEDLLTARRLEQGQLPFRPRTVDLRAFLDPVLALHRSAAEPAGVRLELKGEAPARKIRIDPDRLGQALGNLIQNAVKFTPAGGTVRVGVTERDGCFRFEVEDEGPGIDPDVLAHLFERRKREAVFQVLGRGSGLGLQICRDLVALHGGTVGAENLEGGGSRFWFEIPAEGHSGPSPAGSDESP